MKLQHVAFTQPIPVPGTHLRLAEFSSESGAGPEFGWDIEDDDGQIWLKRGAVEFYTYVHASCIPLLRQAPTAAPPAGPKAPVQPGKVRR